jgi:hypothetical protein
MWSLIICTFTKYYYENHIKQGCIGEKSHVLEMRKAHNILVGKPEKKRP